MFKRVFIKNKKFLLPLIFLLILSYWTVSPLFIKGYFPMHDDTQPARVFAMFTELKKGVFPVRLVDYLGYGYGYPLYNFYAPFPYYIGAVIKLLGIELIVAVKIMFAIGVILSGIFMLFLGMEIAGPIIGLVSAIFYLYAPYHAVNIYVRGAVGEYYAYAFLPLAVLGFYRILSDIKDTNVRHSLNNKIIPSSLGVAGILLSHNILGLIFLYLLCFLFLILFLLYLQKKISLNKLKIFAYSVAFAFGLSAFFVIPAILEKDYTAINSLITGSSNYSRHFVYLKQFWDSPWGFAGSSVGTADGISFKIGKLHLLSALISGIYITYLFIRRKVLKKKIVAFASFFILFIFSLFMMLPLSGFIYRSLPYFAFIQYPWRFLNFTLISVSFMILTFGFIRKLKIKLVIAFLFISAIILVNAKYFAVQYIYPLTEKEYLNSEDFLFTSSDISHEYLSADIVIPRNPKEIREEDLKGDKMTFRILKNNTVEKIYTIIADDFIRVQTNTAWFPGWKLKKNGQLISPGIQNGFISFDIPPGKSIIQMTFKDTPVRIISNTISFLSFILLLYSLSLPANLWPKKRRLR